MPEQVIQIAPFFLLGTGLAIAYFGSLYLTVVLLPRMSRPAIGVILSFLLRVGALLPVLWLVAQSGWVQFAVCGLGFLVGRQLTMLLTGNGRLTVDRFQRTDQ